MSDNQANKANRLIDQYDRHKICLITMLTKLTGLQSSDLEMNMNGMSDNRLTELTCYQTAT